MTKEQATDNPRRDALRLRKEGESLVAESDALWKKIQRPAMTPWHTITNAGPSWIKVIMTDGTEEIVEAGETFSGEVNEIRHQPNTRAKYSIRPTHE